MLKIQKKAIKIDDENLVKLLIKEKADYLQKYPNDENVFHTSAFYNEDTNIMKLFVQEFKSKSINLKDYLEGKNAHQQTPLHAAARKNATKIAEYLICEHEVDKEALDYKKRTPLTIAAEFSMNFF